MIEHVLPRKDGWAVKREGHTRASRVFPKKEQAVAYAKHLVSGHDGTVFVHRLNGTMQRAMAGNGNATIPKSKVETKRRVHVVPADDGWAVRNEHRLQPAKRFESKYGAVRFAHGLAERNNAAMVVHRSSGEIDHIDIPPHYQSMASDLLHLR